MPGVRKLILLVCALLLPCAYVGCTDPEDKPKSGTPSSNAPAKQEKKTDS
jgi:hypothetical protein